MKVYVVTDGAYSDYRVLCICSTKEKALRAKSLYCAENDIAEYELDQMHEHPEGMFWYCVSMLSSGDGADVRKESIEYTHKDKWRPYGDGHLVSFYMWAKDDEHAIKIANERRAILIATNQWTTDWHEWRRRKNEINA